ncbi:hypothetical protein FH972_017011 [Carpinus fangiana]|uniref:Malectin-like domain-containing protein n=1 Tax=Carpinus fangiana TaxID=176857 RepID=A0A5N6RIX0_9ROSI|nr:hypothetical protein FH972_017011 [Carpinus fangiana]
MRNRDKLRFLSIPISLYLALSLIDDRIDPSRARPSSGNGKAKNQKAIIIGGVGGGIVLAIVVGFFLIAATRRRRHKKDSSSSEGPSGWLPLSLYGNSHSAGSAKTNTTEESGNGIGRTGIEEEPFVPSKGKRDPDASLGYDGIVSDSRSTGISMSIGGRSLASEDSDGLTPSAVFSQIMNPKGR